MKALLAVMAITFAGQAQALSCMRLTPQNMYTWAAQAKESYVPVYGTFNVVAPKRPQVGAEELPQGYQVQGTFDGRFVTKTGLSRTTSIPVTVNVTCAAHWCGYPPSGDVRLAVLEKQGDAYVYNAHACPSASIVDPDRTAVRAFRKCWRGGACRDATR